MASIDRIIQQSVNPFDAISSRAGNFWTERQNPASTVSSIHQEALLKIESVLDIVTQDHRMRTVLLYGDSGSGKSYLLGRLKQQLNSKAFFAYIGGNCSDRTYIVRHVLRQTVDSLVRVPDGKRQSQLLLWLKGLSAFKSRSMMKKLLGERNLFIHNFSRTYPVGIYNPKEFFGVLYDLTNPDRYPLACQWLKGDELDEESLKILRVRKSIDSEYAAQKVLENFGRIAAKNRPIVLCFDQLDHINIPSVFSVNTNFHNENLNNFLVIISLVTDIAKQNASFITQSDRARINARVVLKPINLDLAEELWRIRLHPLYCQAQPKPHSPIYPLNRQQLEAEFPGGKTSIRNIITLGKQLIQNYKVGDRIIPEDPLAEFKLVWQSEFNQQKANIRKLIQFSSFELLQLLVDALNTIPVFDLRTSILPSQKYTRYSLQFQRSKNSRKIAIVWSEEANLTGFFSLMTACRKIIDRKLVDRLYLIRAETVGKAKNKGRQIYEIIFSHSTHLHIIPDLDSLHYLATYSHLLKASRVGELVVGTQVPNVEQLKNFVRQSQVLTKCTLLQALNLWTENPTLPQETSSQKTPSVNYREIEEYMLCLLRTQHFLSVPTVIEKTREATLADSLSDAQTIEILQKLARKNLLTITGDDSKPESWLAFWKP